MKKHRQWFTHNMVSGSPFQWGSPILAAVIFLLLMLPPSGIAQEKIAASLTPLVPPQVPARPKVINIHDRELVDPYFWLRDKDNPEVISYLEAENAYADAVMKPETELREKLYQEMLARIQETDLSVPVRYKDYLYYSRTEKGKQYKIYCRRRNGDDTAPEEILLDGNALAEGQKYFRVGSFEVSPNQQLLAFSVDLTGGENFILRVKDLKENRDLSENISGTYFGIAWANDNQTLYYTTFDAALRPYRVYRHALGTATATDELLFEEKDETFAVSLTKTRSGKWIIISTDSNTSSETRLAAADDPKAALRLFAARRPNVEMGVDHHDRRFFIITNEDAQNFKIMETPEDAFDRQNWTEFVGHDIQVKVDGIDMFRDYAVVYERRNGFRTMRSYDFQTRRFSDIKFPEPVYNFWEGENLEFDSRLLRFNYNSLLTPRSVYDLHLGTGTWELKKQYEVLGGFDPAEYQSERLFAVASDGVKIPISVVYKKGLRKDGSQPMYLTGYGAYGEPFDPDFSTNRLSLLNRGFVYAIAHVRGGGEMGRPWYDEGKLLKKRNSFTDFITCAQYLVESGFTSSKRLCINGGSAGGLLMGAVTTMSPDLFGVVVADVPFVDVINTMMDASIPLTTNEYEEWGNPADKAFFEYMLSYSPYDQIQARAYPHLMITAGLNDPRVQFWEPAKFAAKLRAMKTDDRWLLLKTNMGAGHGGASGRYDYLKEIAFEFAFLLKVLNIPF
jgi:oligopeptidase B